MLEYGCELGESDKWGHAIGKLTAADTDKPRITWYLRVVGDQAQRGKKCVFDPGAGPPVEKVILNTTPSLPPSEDSTVRQLESRHSAASAGNEPQLRVSWNRAAAPRQLESSRSPRQLEPSSVHN